MNDETMIVGYCEECGSEIVVGDEAYIDRDGLYFDSLECVCEYHNITKVEF